MPRFMPEKTMRAEPKQSREKRFPLSAGTALFLAFNFMLILGFCKFSFYVLKNHRDAVDRVALVGTYVDVQPAGALKERSPYIKTASGGSVAPAPFFTDFSGKRNRRAPTCATSFPLPRSSVRPFCARRKQKSILCPFPNGRPVFPNGHRSETTTAFLWTI